MHIEPKSLCLSRSIAKRIIRSDRELPVSHLQVYSGNDEHHQIFTMTRGSLAIKIENDWLPHNQRYRLSICDPVFGKEIVMCFFPATLEHDCLAENRGHQDLKNEQIEQGVYDTDLESCIKEITGILEGQALSDICADG